MKKTFLLLALLCISGLIYASQAIALWATTDCKPVSGTAYIGVVAYHSSGIDRIDFTIDDGSVIPVTKETINPETNEYEYVLSFNTSDYSINQWLSISATAFPNWGEPQTLPPLKVVVVNGAMHQTYHVDNNGNDSEGDGTENKPFKTILKALNTASGGDKILVGDGNYLLSGNWDNTFDKFVTIKPKAGCNPIIDSISGFYDGMLKVDGMVFDFSDYDLNVNVIYSNRVKHLWFSNCTFIGAGQENFNNGQAVVRCTHASSFITIENCVIDGFYRAFVFAGDGRNILRNNTIKNMASDIFNPNSETLITGNEVFGTKAPHLFIENLNSQPFNVSSNKELQIHLCSSTNNCDPANYDIYSISDLGSHANNPGSASLEEVINAINANPAFYEKGWAEERNGKLQIYSRTSNYVQQMWISGSAVSALGFNETSYETQAEGAGAHSDIFQYWGSAGVQDTVSNIIFRNNKCYDNRSQGIFPGERVRTINLAIINNLVDSEGKGAFGVAFDVSPDEGEKFYNVLFEFNTIWDGGTSMRDMDTTSVDMTFRNNLYGRRFMGFGDGMQNENWDMDYNYYYWYHWKPPSINEHSIAEQTTLEAPIDLFKDVRYYTETDDDKGDFHLSENSLARDIGIGSAGIFYDLEWNLRDELPDIGAYEYMATTSNQSISSEDFGQYTNLTIYPNPTAGNITLDMYSENETNCSIEIIDLYRKTCLQLYEFLSPGENKLTIKIEQLPPGIYCLVSKVGDKQIGIAKFLKTD